ncbi:MAG: transporter substrate-binding domain-containing protein [Deltaproteobacteria bacterium]|jgi:polar amino acid transport system substrate-binding protein|nr:transporter substrate-binding domain-containing protein [Deltaproteobacteria bacterium]
MKLFKSLALCLCLCLFASAAFAADTELAKKSTINSVLAKGELRVGFDPGYMPFEMIDKNGNYIGFDIDMGRELAKAMGVKFTPVSIDFDGMVGALIADKCDVIISAMTITQQRNLRISFADTYISVGQSVIVNNKHKDTITSWEQLNDPKYLIICRQGTTSEEAVKRYLPKAQYKTFEKEVDGALEVSNNRADAWVYDMPFNVVFHAQQGKNSTFHLDEPFTYEPLGIAIKQGDPDFLNFINNFLRQIRNDGRYDRMYNKWIRTTDWFDQAQN